MINNLSIYLCWPVLIVLLIGCKKSEEHPSHIASKGLNTAVYVANEMDGTVSVIDPVENRLVNTIHVSEDMTQMLMPHNIQVAPDGKTVWITAVPQKQGEEEQLLVLEVASGKIVKRIHLGKGLHLAHVVLDDLSEVAYVTCFESSQVIKIDAKKREEIGRIALSSNCGPHGIRYKSGKLYVANMKLKNMAVIDLFDDEFTEYFLGGICVQTAVTVDSKYAFCSLYDKREIVRLDLAEKKLEKMTLPVESKGPIQIYPSPDNKYLYVCDQGGLNGMPESNKVFVVDIAEMVVVNTYLVGSKPHGIVISNTGDYAYVTNSGDNSVSVIDLNAGKVISSIDVGKAPNGISFLSESGGMP
jgi:YVTN family beta-propeller protein